MALLFILGVKCSAFADPLDQWNWRNPLPQGNDTQGVAFGNHTFVSVGHAGTVSKSLDGISWTTKTLGTYNLNGVTYGNGTFIVVGDDGEILTSPDGENWITRSTGTANFESVTYGSGTFVVVGTAGTILTSPDGTAWASQNLGSVHFEGITYGNSTFVAVGHSGEIYTSFDGEIWTFREDMSFSILGVTYGNGIFIATGSSGSILSSPDGIIWTRRKDKDVGYSLYSVAYGNGKFVAVGEKGSVGAVFTSTDGFNWQSQLPLDWAIYGVIYGDGIFVAVGENGTISTSTDGINWFKRSSGAYDSYRGITSGGGTLVAVGVDGAVLSSPDGINWTGRNSGTTNTLSDVTFGKDNFVAVGEDGTILTSPDGITWPVKIKGTTYDLLDIAYANGIFVAVGIDGIILTSPDGTSWTTRSSGTTNDIRKIIYCNGSFMAVGGYLNGIILTSTDGVDWTSRGHYSGLNGVAYGNGVYVVAGIMSAIYYSSDAINWTSRSLGGYLTDIDFSNGSFVLLNESGRIFTSVDGANWNTRNSGTGNALYGVTPAYDSFFVAGSNGVILQSDSLSPVTPDISVAPASYNFGEVNVGEASAPHPFIITNTGAADLVVGTLTIIGANQSEFQKQNDNVSGQTIALGQSRTVLVTFSPTTTGAKEVSLNIPSNDPDTSTLSVPLTGTGIANSITVSSPNGGESWEPGSTHNITWSYTGSPGTVKLELYKGGALNSAITSGTSAGSGLYSWTIPPGQADGSDYKVRVTSNDNLSVYDISDNSFNIASEYSVSGNVTLSEVNAMTIPGKLTGKAMRAKVSSSVLQSDATSIVTTPINIGQTITGTLTEADQEIDGWFYDFYKFTLSTNQKISIIMRSTQFDTYLELYDQDLSDILEFDDDGGSGVDGGGVTDSRIPSEDGYLDLPAGTYIIGASQSFSDGFGSYTLSLNEPSGTGTSGVIMTFSLVSGTGAVPNTVQTDDSGKWAQTGFKAGTTYRVTPSKENYTFKPDHLDFNSGSDNLNFTGSNIGSCGISVAPASVDLSTGDTQQLTPTIYPADATVGYASDNPSVATVNATGLVTAVAPGSANITVTATKAGYNDAVPVIVPVTVRSGCTAILPSVQTNAPTNIGASFATLNGTILANGGGLITEYGFELSTDFVNWNKVALVGDHFGAYPSYQTGLALGTYYFKAYATNCAGTTYGTVREFVISTEANLVLTAPIVEGQPNTYVQIPVTLKSQGNISGIGFDLSYDSSLLTFNSATNGALASGFTFSAISPVPGKVTVVIFSMTSATMPAGEGSVALLTFHVASGAQSGQSCPLVLSNTVLTDAYGNSLTGSIVNGQFSVLLQQPPTVETNDAINKTAASATLNGDITSNGGVPITEYGFYWGTGQTTPTKVIVGTNNNTGTFTYNLTGLLPATTYYFKAYAVNSVDTSYGDVENFVTNAILSAPVLEAKAGTAIEVPISLKSQGNVSAIQFDLSYDSELLTYLSAENGSITPGFSITANQSGAGKISVLIFSMSGAIIPQGEGAVVLLNFQVAADAQNGQSCVLSPSNASIADAQGDIPSGVSLINGSFTIKNHMKGDLNGDEIINVQDVVRTGNIILGKMTPTNDDLYAADVNGDGVINVQDVVRIVNIILGKA